MQQPDLMKSSATKMLFRESFREEVSSTNPNVRDPQGDRYRCSSGGGLAKSALRELIVMSTESANLAQADFLFAIFLDINIKSFRSLSSIRASRRMNFASHRAFLAELAHAKS